MFKPVKLQQQQQLASANGSHMHSQYIRWNSCHLVCRLDTSSGLQAGRKTGSAGKSSPAYQDLPGYQDLLQTLDLNLPQIPAAAALPLSRVYSTSMMHPINGVLDQYDASSHKAKLAHTTQQSTVSQQLSTAHQNQKSHACNRLSDHDIQLFCVVADTGTCTAAATASAIATANERCHSELLASLLAVLQPVDPLALWVLNAQARIIRAGLANDARMLPPSFIFGTDQWLKTNLPNNNPPPAGTK
jgi:hypothetical protein